MSDWDDAILIGVIARTHGNRGEVIVNPETDFPEQRFREGARLLTREQDGTAGTLEVATMRMHQGRPVILFKGIGSMDDAELLAGRELRIAEDAGDADLLEEGEFFHRDLIGCAVVTESGDPIGDVTAVEGNRAATRLVVRGGRNEVLIPLADEICTVDLEARRITVRPPAGLLELNGEWRPPKNSEAKSQPPKRSEAGS
jgi:16S rRNA processing protein RimM